MTALQRLPLLMAALDKQMDYACNGCNHMETAAGLLAPLIPIVVEAQRLMHECRLPHRMAAYEEMFQASCDVFTVTMGADWCAKACAGDFTDGSKTAGEVRE